MMEGQQYIIQQQEDEEEGPREGELREQDRFLPIYNISKVMKKVVPHSGKVAKEARECVQECVSEFISFITSEASERCQAEKRKTINGEDILFAMSTLGFDNYVEPLKLYLQKYREAMKGERQMEAELSNLGGEVMAGQQLQALTASEGDVLLTYSNGQQFQL
jgi:nuclear transcription Y subunit beta